MNYYYHNPDIDDNLMFRAVYGLDPLPCPVCKYEYFDCIEGDSITNCGMCSNCKSKQKVIIQEGNENENR